MTGARPAFRSAWTPKRWPSLTRPDHLCPIAARVVDLVESFRDSVSYEEVTVTVETAERSFRSRTSLQKGLSGILGIYMVSSGCPVVNKLRPMVATHLDAGLSGRLAALQVQDESLNALSILSCFGDDTTFTILAEDLERWERIFREHYG